MLCDPGQASNITYDLPGKEERASRASGVSRRGLVSIKLRFQFNRKKKNHPDTDSLFTSLPEKLILDQAQGLLLVSLHCSTCHLFLSLFRVDGFPESLFLFSACFLPTLKLRELKPTYISET